MLVGKYIAIVDLDIEVESGKENCFFGHRNWKEEFETFGELIWKELYKNDMSGGVSNVKVTTIYSKLQDEGEYK